MNNQQGRGGGMGAGPLGFAVKGLAAGIGLASEGIHRHKEKKAAEIAAKLSRENSESGTLSPPAYNDLERKTSSTTTDSKHREEKSGHTLEEGDEEQWDLDDAQDGLAIDIPKAEGRPFERDPKKITQHFVDDYPLPQGVELRKLGLSVILPQRRPKDRSRGFIRAYAPELQECGINQAMFIDFLDTFNQATLASPWLNAINLAGLAFLPLPTGISQAATIALAIAVHIAKNMQSRHRYNSVLDQMNDSFYRPRGLYAMVMTWNPESDDMAIGVNLNEMIGKNITPPEGIVQKTKHSLRSSMGNTNGVAFTETAPLIFPQLDELAGNGSQAAQTQKEKLKHAKSFVDEYFDRRAQAKHAGDNPTSRLAVGPKPTFTSRYSDPNNPSNSGDILALLTGGKLSMPPRGGGFGGGFGGRGMGYGGNAFDDRMAMSYGGGRGFDRFGGRGMGMSYSQQYPNQPYQNQMSGNGRGLGLGDGVAPTVLLQQGIRRILQHHVLYLLIVNMPSDEELAHATHIMDQAQQQTA